MKNIDTTPYKFYFIDENLFKNITENIIKNKNEIKLSTIGTLSNFNAEKNECLLNLEKDSIKINTTRIETNFKFNINTYYYVYGNLKLENESLVIFINFFRIINDKVNIESLREITNTRYKL